MDPFSAAALAGGVAVNFMYDQLKSATFNLRDRTVGTDEERAIEGAYGYACDQEDQKLVTHFLDHRKVRCVLLAYAFTKTTPSPDEMRKLYQQRRLSEAD